MPCEQCHAKLTTGGRCKLRTCMMFPYCWIHLKALDKLQVKPSNIPGAGKGLFYVGREPFPANKRIVYYSAKKKTHEPNEESTYELQVGNRFLNSDDPSNYVGRYINASDEPNYVAAGGPNIANTRFGAGLQIKRKQNRWVFPIFSTRVILPGEELYIPYSAGFWGNPG